jgi:hypothetical protein
MSLTAGSRLSTKLSSAVFLSPTGTSQLYFIRMTGVSHDACPAPMRARFKSKPSAFRRAYAYCRGKICIGLKTDVRSLLTMGDNPMVECALRGTFGDMDDVSEWIRNRRWERH